MEKVQALTVKHHIQSRLSKSPDVFRRYTEHIGQSKKPQTVFEYLKDALLFWNFLKERAPEQQQSWSETSLKELTKEDVESFLFVYLEDYERTYERLSGKVVVQEFKNHRSGQRRKLSALRSFSRYLMTQEHWLSHDITFGIELEPDLAKAVQSLNQLELDTYFSAIEQFTEDDYQRIRNRVMSQFFLYMGLKVSEVLALDIPDIHLDEMTVKVTRKDEEVEILPLPKQMKKDLKRYLAERAERPVPMGWHERALFVSLQNKRLNPKTIRYSMERYKKFTDIQMPLTPQIFRNTYASRTLLHTDTLDEVAKRLGNADKYATKRTYTRKSVKAE